MEAAERFDACVQDVVQSFGTSHGAVAWDRFFATLSTLPKDVVRNEALASGSTAFPHHSAGPDPKEAAWDEYLAQEQADLFAVDEPPVKAAVQRNVSNTTTSAQQQGLSLAALKTAPTLRSLDPSFNSHVAEEQQQQPQSAPWSSSSNASGPGGWRNNNTNPPPRFQGAQKPAPPSGSGFLSARSRFNQNFGNDQEFDGEQQQQLPQSGAKPFKPPTRLGQPPSGGNGPSARNSNFIKQPVQNAARALSSSSNGDKSASFKNAGSDESEAHPKLRGMDPELIERIENEILESGQPVTFDDIAGLTFAKQCIEEMVVWPVKNPEFYTGLRQLPKGLLLFGPPGTGKTQLGRAIAHECNATFFSISASSLTSKWIGEGEKMVRAMFAVASVRQPSVVFIDEIDSLLTQRSSDENEASRRIKTEFLVQFDGAATSPDDVVLIIGATNRPQELDEAARRRFVRRLYVPLPDLETRFILLSHLLKKNEHCMSEEEIRDVTQLTEGYSGADVTNLAREASMGPLREVMRGNNAANKMSRVLRPIHRHDFEVALKSVKASVSNIDMAMYVKWNEEFGTQQYSG